MKVLESFHPAVRDWFLKQFSVPTESQAEAWPAIKAGKHALIAAPTGSGKTLAAFLSAIDDLVWKATRGELADETHVVYVSPLKALSNDIKINLEAPLRGIQQNLEASGITGIEIRTLVRTGDTPAKERAAMTKKPPHIIVTTPESLYILLTSDGGRRMLSTVRTLIVDEIHAMVDDKRGSHLSLSIERLTSLIATHQKSEISDSKCQIQKLVRIGLSATQKPIEEVARFLVGRANIDAQGKPDCTIIDSGHTRRLDLALEIPNSPLESLMSNEVWEEIYDRIATLIRQHQTTLVFVNTRRMAERVARHLGERLGDDNVTAHHGSLAREIRLAAEQRLKSGELSALVATASLELGIDIGAVDLVIQIGSTRAISTLLQRIGRSNHTVSGFPKGRIIPLSRDELIECVALIDSVRRGELDHLTIPEQPLDILAQQIVATVAPEEWTEDALFEMVRRAYPFRNLKREKFDEVVRMLSEGFTTRRGRRGTYLHHDAVNHRIRGRRGARLSAITNGGAIPDTSDYRVILEPSETFVGTLNEDFAIESLAGDIFQLGNASYEIKRVGAGEVRVLDAHGQPPSIPFWLGEAPGRSEELSQSVSRLRKEIAERLEAELGAVARGSSDSITDDPNPVAILTNRDSDTNVATGPAMNWLVDEVGISQDAARQIVEYLALTKIALGAMPTQEDIVVERFFDENGSTHVVIHAPFGSRLNRAWGLALRKRFCRAFNFELQAAATEDSIVLSLGPTHSFPLETIFSYLNSKSVCDVLTQALLNAPMFNIRWRWNATRALAIPRWRSGGKVAPQLQRMAAEDLLALVFPDQLACAENLTGPIEVPAHPLVEQTVRDCLEEAMDLRGLEELLRSIERGERNLIAREMNEPSPLAQEILTAKPYAFLDDAPAEERRTLAVMNRRFLDAETAADLGKLDQAAIDRVREEAWPQAENADELHDALMQLGFIKQAEGERRGWRELLDQLTSERRATEFVSEPGAIATGSRSSTTESIDPVATARGSDTFWVAAERLNQLRAIHPNAALTPAIDPPEPYASESWNFDNALVEILRGRLEGLGPITVNELAKSFSLPTNQIEIGLAKLESEGFAMQGQFTPTQSTGRDAGEPRAGMPALQPALQEWCSRRLLARIHRYTLNRLRKEIEPVSAADFMRFLFVWQKVAPEHKVEGATSVAAILDQLEGFEAPAGSWESEILPARIADYDPAWLDALCASGRLTWLRLSPPKLSTDKVSTSSPVRSTPMVLLNRKNVQTWNRAFPSNETGAQLSTNTQTVYDYLKEHGASFFVDIVSGTDLLASMVEEALGELVFRGMVTADSFTGLRALLTPLSKTTNRAVEKRRRRNKNVYSMDEAGRWVRLGTHASGVESSGEMRSEADREVLETIALKLLQRYGVVFRKILDRESITVPWRDLLRVLRRLETRGEIRGGRFIGGFSGEQFATPEAVQLLRSIRRAPADGTLISISAADPLNMLGILLPTGRLAPSSSNRVLYRDGVPIAVIEAKQIRLLVEMSPAEQWQARQALLRRHVPPKVRAYLNQTGRTVSPPQVSTLTH
ncbi:MAG TPA: DEAD/DEAH box helicase [Pyrinomonadaceae bacterium]|jgi:ATP-dependent Lhr-like helicase|nr:DEAD/DEAH box helicase [Pyrinomonadaceae bacterium]